MSRAPMLSNTLPIPVEEMKCTTLIAMLDDIHKQATTILHRGVHSGTLEEASKEASGKLVLSYNLVERWVEAEIERRSTEPF